LALDRLSDQRFGVHLFRLYLHALAMNLLVRLRCLIAAAMAKAATEEGCVAAAGTGVPSAVQSGEGRRRRFRERRRRDPLGEGHPCTWRPLVIQVAAVVVVSVRRIVVRLSASWPHQGWYRRVCQR
jgi:hypothetical protein